MADQIGTLFAQVVADQAGFRSDMAAMATTVQSTTAKMNANLSRIGKASDGLATSFRLVTRVAGAFGVALSARALGQFSMGAINAAAELHNLSTRLNVSVESLSELQHVARLSDIEFGNFTKGLQVMSRNFGEASKGSKSMQETFRQLGLDFRLLSASTVDVQLESVAEALARVTDEGQRAAFAQEVFGRGGQEMLQAFEDGAEGVRNARQELRDLGGVTLPETAKAANDAKDSMDRLKGSTTALSNELVNVLAPALKHSVDWWREFLFPSGSQFGAGADRLREQVDAQIAEVQRLQKLSGSQGEWEANATWFDRLIFPDQTENITNTTTALAAARAELERLSAAWRAATASGVGGGGASAAVPGLVTPSSQMIDTEALAAEAMGPTNILQERLEGFRQIEEEKTKIVEEEYQRQLEIATDATAGMLEVARFHADQEVAMRHMVTDSAIGLLSALGSKHRGAAIAALAIQKALAVKEILVQSQVAAMRALAELGPIAGPPVAASFLLKGKIGAALVAATGLVEAAQLSSGGTQSTLGTTANPINTRSASSAGSNFVPQSHSQKVVEITIHGGVVTASAVRELVAQIKKEIDDSDVIIFSPDSRQAQLLGVSA